MRQQRRGKFGSEKPENSHEEEMLTNEGKVALQQLSVRVKPGLSQPAVLVLANDVIHDVSQEARHHQDLHVVALPAVLQMCWNLTSVEHLSF